MVYDFLAVDVETTCWDKQPPAGSYAEIIEVGIVECRGGLVTKSETYFVKPRFSSISKFCADLTGIIPAQIKQFGMSYRELCKRIRNDFDVKLPWCSWSDFDEVMFRTTAYDELNLLSHDDFDKHMVPRFGTADKSNGLSKPGPEFYPFDGPYFDAKALAVIKTGLSSSTDVLKHLGINRTMPHHRAFSDAFTLSDIVQRLLTS